MDLNKTKASWEISKLTSPYLFSKCSSALQFLSALFNAAEYFLFEWFLLPESSFPEQLFHSSNISKFWSLQDNFNIPASFTVRDSQMIISSPSKWLGHISGSVLCNTLSSGWLHSTAPSVLATYPMILLSSVGWVFLLLLGLIHSLPYAYSMVPSLRCSPWQLHTFKTSRTWVILIHDQVHLPH